MKRVEILAACLLAVVITDGGRTPASAQTPAAPRMGTLVVDRGLLGSDADRRSGTLDRRAAGPRDVPHRHWSWLFPQSPVAPFASDPLSRRHWWLDPLLRRHWWK